MFFNLKPGITIKEYDIQNTYSCRRSQNNVIMMGGGLDSYITLMYMVDNNIQNIRPIFVDYGQLSSGSEANACLTQCELLGQSLITVFDNNSILHRLNPDCKLFDDLNESPVAYGRNLFMLMIGAGYGDTVWLGLDKPMDGKEPFFDCTEDYMVMATTILGMPELTVKHPFLDVDKIEAVQYGLERDPHLFENSFSCWTPIEGNPCGQCDKCIKNKRLMGVTDDMLGG